MEDTSLLIGELAERVGVNRETLRYYERRGLLKPEKRSPSGYRLYGAEAADRLRFIKRAQTFGFSLDEISVLIQLHPESSANCRKVLQILDRKVDDLSKQITEMKQFHRQLSRYRDRCQQAMVEGAPCPVIAEASR